jgi:hypothetical protein
MRKRDEEGVALITVVLGSFVILLFMLWMVQEAVVQYGDAQRGRWEDVTVAGTEALLDRYAAKVTIDPAYYLHWVDEAEMARKCLTTGTPITGATVQPGTAWNSSCTSWTYYSGGTTNSACSTASTGTTGSLLSTSWYSHPLLNGNNTATIDDVQTRLQVCPPDTSNPVTVQVASRQRGRSVDRVIQASVRAVALSEFFRVTQDDLNYGSGAEIFGKVYSGANLTFQDTPKPIVHKNVYAEGQVSVASTVTFADGSKAFDVDGGGTYGKIRTVFPQALNFDKFWNDLSVLKSAACNGSGLCLQDATVKAWMVQPYVSGGVGKIKIWKSTYSAPSSSCLSSEEWWWINARSSSANWQAWTAGPGSSASSGVYDVPVNGTLWADNHVVVGKDDSNISRLKGSLSIYAGSSANPKNVIINTDIIYDAPTSFDVMGLLASDEIVINPNAVGTDATIQINAALLGQTDTWRAGRSCGADGNVMTPNSSTLDISGSIATRNSAGVSADFDTRNYGFDSRLEYLRPPFFPLLDDGWHYEDWKELKVPAWGR